MAELKKYAASNDPYAELRKEYEKAYLSLLAKHQNAQEQIAEETVEKITREEKLAEAIEDKQVKVGKIAKNKDGSQKNAAAATLGKKLDAIGQGIEAFQNAEDGAQDPETGKLLEEALADSFAQTLAYATKYNVTPETINEMMANRKDQDSSITMEVEEMLDPNNPNNTINKPKIVRTLEDGTTHTYEIGENGKIAITVQDPTQNQDNGQQQ